MKPNDEITITRCEYDELRKAAADHSTLRGERDEMYSMYYELKDEYDKVLEEKNQLVVAMAAGKNYYESMKQENARLRGFREAVELIFGCEDEDE